MDPSKLKIAMVGHYPAAEVVSPASLRSRHRPEHPASWLRALAEGMREQEAVVPVIFSLSRRVRRRVSASVGGIDIHFIPQILPARLDWHTLCLFNALQLRSALRRVNPDVVHAFGIETGDAVSVSWLPFRKTCFIQGIIEEYAPYVDRGPIEQKLRIALERRTIRKLDGAVAETEFAGRWAESRGGRNIARIPHALNVEFMRAQPSNVSAPVAICAGTLSRLKAYDTAIRAFARVRVPGARLLIIGDGPERATLERVARQAGLTDRVAFRGRLGRNEIIQEMQHARLLCVPSRMDTSPNILTEGHALGLPVIGCAVGGIQEMIDDGRDGYLVARDDVCAMGTRMHELLAKPDVARSMGMAGRRKVAEINDPARVASMHVAFFREVARAGGVTR